MFNNSPYRHSVWVDIFGVLLFGAVLLGGAGYLLYHAGGAARSVTGSSTVASGGGALSPQPRLSRLARRPILSPGPNPLFGGGRATPPGGSGVEAPFSESWQQRAAPDLIGPAGSFSSPSDGGAGVGGAAPEPSGPTIASRRPSGGTRGGSAQAGGGRAGSGWRTEARRFSGRARTLSNQLGQMARSSPEGRAASSPEEEASRTPSASRASANANSDPGTPSDPSQVPIGGLEWLAAAGAAYALRRLGMQAGEE